MSKPILAPRFVSTIGKTVTSGYGPLDVALCFALSARLGTSLRKTAERLINRLPYEQRARMKQISKMPDDHLGIAAYVTVNTVTGMLGIKPEIVFTPEPTVVPRCHMKPMVLGNASWWHCQCCNHTKPITWSPEKKEKAA